MLYLWSAYAICLCLRVGKWVVYLLPRVSRRGMWGSSAPQGF